MQILAALLSVSASLHITVWPEGPAHPSKAWTLRCAPAGGTLPRPARACARLARLDHPFTPVPRNEVCTQIYGGPSTALVTGRFRGHAVRARFNRRDGCQIARWDRVRVLFPTAGPATRQAKTEPQ